MTPTLTSDGHLDCDLCPARCDHTIVVDHPELTPRHQLRQAAGRAGWKQTSAGLDVCPACADGEAAILVPGWCLFWTPEKALPPGSNQAVTEIMPAVENAA